MERKTNKQNGKTNRPTPCCATQLTIVGPQHAVLSTGVVLGVELDARMTAEALHQGGSGARLARLVTLPAQAVLLVCAAAARSHARPAHKCINSHCQLLKKKRNKKGLSLIHI